MATKPKKNRNVVSSKRKRPYKKRQKTSTLKRILLILSMIFLIVMGIGYYFLVYKNNTHIVHPKKTEHSAKKLLDDLKKVKVKKHKNKHPLVQKTTHKSKIIHKPPFNERGKIKDKDLTPTKNNTVLIHHGKKPKLAIIIDDVHTKKQMKRIKELGFKITPSIFPPYASAKHSNLLAKGLKHYMIHLPMESSSKQFNSQDETLLTSFSDEKIVNRVMKIRQLFPKAKYINNHTGSVFTSNYKAMKKLYIALKMEGFTFVDSFTESSSKVRKIAHEFGDAYIRRDIFIDNKQELSYIHSQLKLAVKKAKKKGYAIAIGHPHKVTMKALSLAKHILKDVELVYIDDICKRR